MILEIFMRSVNTDGPLHEGLGTNCHVWTGIEKDNHGIYVKTQAHRVLWEYHNGKIAGDLVVRHKCDVGICVRLDHLMLGTQQDNIRDMNERGRARGGGHRGSGSSSSKVTAEDVVFIRENFNKLTKKELSKRFGISIGQIYRINSGERWADITPQPTREQQILAMATTGPYHEELGSNCLEMKTPRKLLRYKGKTRLAHRIAMMIHTGEDIADGVHVLHKCDNAKCINHEHLELGDHEKNMQDRQARGRTAGGTRHGMARLSEDNVRYIRQNPENKSGSDLATQFKVTTAHISGIMKRKTWRGIE